MNKHLVSLVIESELTANELANLIKDAVLQVEPETLDTQFPAARIWAIRDVTVLDPKEKENILRQIKYVRDHVPPDEAFGAIYQVADACERLLGPKS